MKDPKENEDNNFKEDKDKRTREKKNKCNGLVGDLVNMILKDYSFQNRNWEKRIESANKAIQLLKDPQFFLKQLTSLMELIPMKNQSFSQDVTKAKTALQELKSFFHRQRDIILNQDYVSKSDGFLPDSISLNQNGDLHIRESKEMSQSFGEGDQQMMANLGQTHQTVVNSCPNMPGNDVSNQYYPIQVQGNHGLEIVGEQSGFNYPEAHDSIQINQKGKNLEVHNQECATSPSWVGSYWADKALPTNAAAFSSFEPVQVEQLLTTDQGTFWTDDWYNMSGIASVPATNLDEGISNAIANEASVNPSPDEVIGNATVNEANTKPSPDEGNTTSNAEANEANMKPSPDEGTGNAAANEANATPPLDEGTTTSNAAANDANMRPSPDESTDNAATNEANTKPSPDEGPGNAVTDEPLPPYQTFMEQSNKDFKRNRNVLVEIFDKHPHVDSKFQICTEHLQNIIMNSLVEVYLIIMKSEQEMPELEDITFMEVMVRDMKCTGLQLEWLETMLANVRKRLESKESILNLRKRIREEAEESKQEQSKLKKEPRFQ